MTSIDSDGDHMVDLELDPEDEHVSSNAGNATPDLSSDGEDNDDIIAARIAQDEQGLEPPRHTMSPSPVEEPGADFTMMDIDCDAAHSSDDKDPPNTVPNRVEVEFGP